MMKKLLALLMALLLPVAALCETAAEPTQLELMMTINEEYAANLIASLGLFEAGEEEKLSAAVAKLLNGAGLRIVSQDNATRMELLLSGKALLDFSVLQEGGNLVLVSDLMAPYGLAFPQDELEKLSADQLFGSYDWAVLVDGVTASAESYLSSLPSTTQRGSFAGDAFSGGVYCQTWTLEDADVAAFLNALLTDDVRVLLGGIADAAEAYDMNVLSTLDEALRDMAEANACQYVIRYVTDANHAPVGISTVAYDGERQLCTLSIGFAEDAWKLVFGFSLEDANYWHEHSIQRSASTLMKGMETTTYTGKIREFTASKDEDYAYGRIVSEEEKFEAAWKMNIVTNGGIQAMSFQGDQQIVGGARVGLKASGERNANGYGTFSATLILEDVELVTFSASLIPSDPIATNVSSLTLIDALHADTALLDAASNALAMGLMTRMLTVLPMDLLMYLQ